MKKAIWFSENAPTAAQVAEVAAMSRAVSPHCGRKGGPEHFACCSGAAGGRIGGKATGDAKRRGDSAHYRAMVARRKDRKANNAEAHGRKPAQGGSNAEQP